MASLAAAAPQRPVLCAFLYPPQYLTAHAPRRVAMTRRTPTLITGTSAPPRRQLSQSAAQQSPYDFEKLQKQEMRRSMAREPSMAVMTREQSAKMARMPALDIGLFPDTLVMPAGAALPGLLSAARARLEWHRLKTRALEAGSLVYYKVLTRARPWPKLRLSDTADQARRLHFDMWTAFAAGDEGALGKICSSGLARDLSRRIGARKATGKELEWELLHYNGRPKVMSHRASLLPGVEKLAIRQAVVRIRSRQSMGKLGVAGGKAFEDTAKDVEEYFVIQKQLMGNEEGEWRVWGTTKETDINTILALS